MQKSIKQQLSDSRAELEFLIPTSFSADLKQGITNQLGWLLDVDAWVEGDVLPKPESFKTLIKFMELVGCHAPPSIGLLDDGHIVASWQNEIKKLVLECECNSDQKIKWFTKEYCKDKNITMREEGYFYLFLFGKNTSTK